MKRQRTVSDSAFIVGYQDGMRFRTYISRNQAERKLRGLSSEAIEAYISGREDGVRRDNFRVCLLNAETEYGSTVPQDQGFAVLFKS